MHWSIGLLVVLLIAFLGGVWLQKSYPGVVPVVG